MREMKDSGVPWIGEIPKSWQVAPLWRTLRRRTEVGHAGETVLSLYRDLGIVPKDSRDDNHNVTSLDTSMYKFVRKGDFVINKMKAWQGSMAVSGYQGIISPAYHVCEFVNSSIYPAYLHYLLRNPSYLPEYGRLSSGLRIGQWDLSYDDFKNIPHLIPPLHEQHRIADFLDTKCAEIDSILEKTRASIEDYKKLKLSVITEAVTKGIRDCRPMKDSGVEWIGAIPKEWGIASLKRVLAGIQDGTHATLQRVDQGFPLLSAKNIQEGKIIIGDNESFISETDYQAIVSNGFPQKGDILFCCIGGSIGKCCMYDFEDSKAFQRSVTFIRTNEKAVNKYVYYLFLSSVFLPQYDLYSNVSAQAGIYMGDLQKFTITHPSFAEQQEIVAYLDEKCAAIDSLISSKEALITELEAYKKILIYEYVTGKKEEM